MVGDTVLEPARAVEAQPGYVVNLTDFTFEEVMWPGFPALIEPSGMRVLRMVFWNSRMNAWCAITPIAVPDSGCIEIDSAFFANLLLQLQLPTALALALAPPVAAPTPLPVPDSDADPDSGF